MLGRQEVGKCARGIEKLLKYNLIPHLQLELRQSIYILCHDFKKDNAPRYILNLVTTQHI